MISTLILLYALDTGQIPMGCYIAAWVLASVRAVAGLIKWLLTLLAIRNKRLKRGVIFILKTKVTHRAINARQSCRGHSAALSKA